ncbi:unnamed protein product [Lactuca saligna]|uniref:SWIM-type domain-containing protein n=1 Tax=Lactuca saligna TaxID=75948 RepID=A0AA35Z4F9_LACSI|nr:unnamed protein product [Lactuca saligna]
MRFSNPMELKNCLTNYVVKNGYNLYYEKNDSQRLLVRCSKDSKNPSCPFRLWASWMSSERSFQIKSLVDDHNCSRIFKLGSIVTYKWIGKHFKNKLLKNPKMSIRKMKAKVSTKFNLIFSVTQCRNARRYALDEIKGSLIEHYGKVWSYDEEIMRTNPGSTVKIDVNAMPDSTTYFSKMYVCFKSVKDGWIATCKRVIGVGGCFLKGIYRGQLLAAMGRDANHHIFPIAWVVVAVENKETWKWFLNLLLSDIKMRISHGLTLISDQHKGLVQAIKERVSVVEHRQCARHIYANFKKRFKCEQYRKFFGQLLLVLLNQNLRAFFEVDKACDAYENGISKSFNSIIDLARKRPLLTMLEEIRIYAMERIFWGVIYSGVQKYEVRIGNDGYAMDLTNNTCGCRSWQVSSIPCVHVVAAISYLNRNAEDYVIPWFHTTMFLICYNHTINPLNGSSMWPEAPYMKPLPPQKRRLPGRPTLKRKMDQSERESKGKTRHTISKVGAVNRCTICRERGHNSSTCPTIPADVASTSRPKNKKPKKCKKEKAPHVEPVQVDDPHPITDALVDDPVNDVSAQPVATRQRIRKYSERITKIGLRRKVLKKEGSTDHHPMVLE